MTIDTQKRPLSVRHHFRLVSIALALAACTVKDDNTSAHPGDDVDPEETDPCADAPEDCDPTPTPGPGDEDPTPAPALISGDITLDALFIPEDTVTIVTDGAVVTVTGDAQIDGTLVAEDGPLVLLVEGDAEINGAIQALVDDPPEVDGAAPYRDQPIGMYVIVEGALTVTDTATLSVTGPIVVADTESELDSTPDELQAEIDAYDDESDPDILAPLPPAPLPETPARDWFISGTIDFSLFPRGTKFRIRNVRDLYIDKLTVLPSDPLHGASSDQSGEPGEDARGRNGKKGSNLLIKNEGGALNFVGPATFQMGDGGDGGNATSVCASATGGDGGPAGKLRMSAKTTIDFSAPVLIIPGLAGDGGEATVTGINGADGAPGEAGCDAGPATGGDGADQKKTFRARGAVLGLANVTVSDVWAGDGGEATATAGNGGNGDPCFDGGDGGDASAEGGDGGDASLNAGGLPLNLGEPRGGFGGDATATSGNGGNGGDCLWPLAPGSGGAAGAATATGGAAGDPGGLPGLSTLVPGTPGTDGVQITIPWMLPIYMNLADGLPEGPLDGAYAVAAFDGDGERLEDVTAVFDPGIDGYIGAHGGAVVVEYGGTITVDTAELIEESERPFTPFDTVELELGEFWAEDPACTLTLTVTDLEGDVLISESIAPSTGWTSTGPTTYAFSLGSAVEGVGQIQIAAPFGSMVIVGQIGLTTAS